MNKQPSKLENMFKTLNDDLLLALILHGENSRDNSGLLNKLMGELYKR
jgi:hypothetical protein